MQRVEQRLKSLLSNFREPSLKGAGGWVLLISLTQQALFSPPQQILGLFKIHKEGIPLLREPLFTAHCWKYTLSWLFPGLQKVF